MDESELEFRVVPQNRGGQHVGNESGILAIHTATGIGVYSHTERSQFKNKLLAVKMLKVLIEDM